MTYENPFGLNILFLPKWGKILWIWKFR